MRKEAYRHRGWTRWSSTLGIGTSGWTPTAKSDADENGEKRKFQTFPCPLVFVFGTAPFVVSGVSVFPFACALWRRLFLEWAFLLFVSLVRSGKVTVALSQQEPSVWWGYTQGTENSDPRSFLQIPPAGEFDGGDAATSHFGVFSGHWHEFTGVVRSQFYSGNSTRIFLINLNRVCTSD